MNCARATIRATTLLLLIACGCGRVDGTAVPLPGGAAGIGFDDLGFSRGIGGGRVLVPGGRSGNLDLIDPDTMVVTAIGGFSVVADYGGGGHEDGVTSVTEGRGLLFATDRTARTVSVIDPERAVIVTSIGLTGTPDYVRYVETTHEIWITEPGASRIETFIVPDGKTPPLVPAGTIAVPGGPESLVIDATRGRAYTNLWEGETLALDVRTKSPEPLWKASNGCEDSRGLALDEGRGLLFAACAEGKVSVLDVGDGSLISDLAEGVGVDVIGYSPELGHLYVAGGRSETLGIVAVGRTGELSLLGNADTTEDASCVTADDRGRAWVCDPIEGQLLRIDDEFPAGGD